MSENMNRMFSEPKVMSSSCCLFIYLINYLFFWTNRPKLNSAPFTIIEENSEVILFELMEPWNSWHLKTLQY